MHVQADRLGLVTRLVDGVNDNPNELTVAPADNVERVTFGIEDRDGGNNELWITVRRDELFAALAVTVLPIVTVDAPDGGAYYGVNTTASAQ